MAFPKLRLSRCILFSALCTKVFCIWNAYEASYQDEIEWMRQKEMLMRYNTSITQKWLKTVNGSQSAIVPSSQSMKKPRMLICITGQASRLELESKVTNVLISNVEQFRINLFMHLAPANSTSFVNPETDTHRYMSWNSSRDMIEYVRGRLGTRLNKHVTISIEIEDQERNPLVVNEYYQYLNKNASLVLKRVHSHVRQWLALFRCWLYLVQTSDDQPYRVVVRLRDDSFVFQPFLVYSMNYTNSVLVPSCLGWGGYNDKASVFDAKYSDIILGKPALVYYFEYDSLNVRVRNPEQYLKAVFTKFDVPVKLVDIDTMPMYTSRISTQLPAINNQPCFLFDIVHLGYRPICYPSSCFIRQRILCSACPGDNIARFERSFLYSDSLDDQKKCSKPAKCPLGFFNPVP